MKSLALLLSLFICLSASCQNNFKEMGVKYQSVINENVAAQLGMDTTRTHIRLPNHIVTKNGTILITCDGDNDWGPDHKIILARSIDKGLSWEYSVLKVYPSNNCIVYDGINNNVFVFGGKQYIKSCDEGKTWTPAKTLSIEVPEGVEGIMSSPNNGIQLSNGVLVVPFRGVKMEKGKLACSVNFVMYSRDYGETWEQSPSTPLEIMSDELTVVEYKKNQIMLNTRGGSEQSWNKTRNGRRVFVQSIKPRNSKKKWSVAGWKLEPESDGKMWDPICNASLIKAKISRRTVGLFCNCYMPNEYWPRKNLLLQFSKDFIHWQPIGYLTPKDKVVYGYCSLWCINGKITFCYEDIKEGIMYADITSLIDEELK